MDDQQFGTAIRTLRLRRRWRQEDLARAAHASRSVVSRIERGHVDGVGIERTRRIAAALEARVSVDLRWRGGEIARLLDQRHAAMQEGLAARLGRLVGWQFVAEASFSVYGERGSIDLLVWHAQRQALLVIELKSELPDLQDLLATLDRKRRLAPVIAGERGWRPRVVAAWVVLEESHGNRRRVATHEAVLRHSYRVGARQMSRWLVRPDSPVAALAFLTIARPGSGDGPWHRCGGQPPAVGDGRAWGWARIAARWGCRAVLSTSPGCESPPGARSARIGRELAGEARRAGWPDAGNTLHRSLRAPW